MTFYSKKKSNTLPHIIRHIGKIRDRELREAVKLEEERIKQLRQPKPQTKETV